MISIVSGGIDRGKTSAMIDIYKRENRGGGFVSCKCFNSSGEFMGYDIQNLATGESMPLARKSPFIPTSWVEGERCGPYSFSCPAFDFAKNIIEYIIKERLQPVFVDEIGPLELRGRGFAQIFSMVLGASLDMYVAVREHCLTEVAASFKITKYRIINVVGPNGK